MSKERGNILIMFLIIGVVATSVLFALTRLSEHRLVIFELISQEYECLNHICKIKWRIANRSDFTEHVVSVISVYSIVNGNEARVSEAYMNVALKPGGDGYFMYPYPYKVRPSRIVVKIEQKDSAR